MIANNLVGIATNRCINLPFVIIVFQLIEIFNRNKIILMTLEVKNSIECYQSWGGASCLRVFRVRELCEREMESVV